MEKTIHRAGFNAAAAVAFTAVFIIILTLTAYILSCKVIDSRLRMIIAHQFEDLAGAISEDLPAEKLFSVSSGTEAEYKQLSAQFSAYLPYSSFRGIYTVYRKNDGYYFGPESYERSDSMASKPGDIYKNVPQGLREAYSDKKTVIYGPYKDEFGQFVSIFKPVIDMKTSEVKMILAADMIADDWVRQVKNTAAVFSLAVFSAVLFIAVSVYLMNVLGKKMKHNYFALCTLFICLVLSGLMYFVVRDIEINEDRTRFFYAADLLHERLKDMVRAVEKKEMETVLNELKQDPGLDFQKAEDRILDDMVRKNVMENMLEKLGRGSPGYGKYLYYDLEEAGRDRMKASGEGVYRLWKKEVSYHPVFLMGRTFVFMVRPGISFGPSTFLLKASVQVLFVFLLLSFGISFYIWSVMRRREMLEKTIDERTKQLKSANDAKSEFLANMSHEIRTPMNGIMGMLQLLLESRLNSEQEKYALIAKDSSESLLRILNDILDLSKIESGKLVFEETQFDPVRTVEDIIDLLSVGAAERNNSLRLEIEGQVPRAVLGDPVRLRQIIINLMSNSIKFTENGTVQVKISFSAYSPGKISLNFEVSDSGIGIAPEKLGILFNNFIQADGSVTRKYGGTGLGLSISKKLTEMMGGSIHVTSILNKGSVFSFNVLAGEIQDNNEILKNENEKKGSKIRPVYEGKKALVAEDNEVNAKILEMLLRKRGIMTQSANNGAQALELMTKNRYDIIFMDCSMPVMDGFETTKKARMQGQRTTVVALTAYAGEGDRDKCINAGMNDYITKPIYFDAVDDVLAKWLGEGSLVQRQNPEKTSGIIFDFEGVMKRFKKDIALAEAVIESYAESMPDKIRQLQAALRANDVQNAEIIAHTIRGASANLGAVKIKEKAEWIEMAVINGSQALQDLDASDMPALYAEFIAEAKDRMKRGNIK